MALTRRAAMLAVIGLATYASPLLAQEDTVRLRDLATLGAAGTRRVMGYGLVVGLEGTGDQSWGSSTAAGGGSPSVRTVMNLLRRFQIDLPPNGLRIRNVAAVMVTGEISPYARTGTIFPVQVASIGDASSLVGGTLLMAPLLSEVSGEPVATAQGPLPLPPDPPGRRSVNARGRFGPTRMALATAGQVTAAMPVASPPGREIPVSLHTPDPTTALAIERRLREWAGDSAAVMVDAGAVIFLPPDTTLAGLVRWQATADTLSIEVPRTEPRILWDARAGVLVAGGDIPVRAGTIQLRGVHLDLGGEGATPTVRRVVQALYDAGAEGGDVGRALQALAQAKLVRAEVIVQ